MEATSKKIRSGAESEDRSDDMERIRFAKVTVTCEECCESSVEKVKFTLSKGIPNFITCKHCGDTFIYMKEFVARESSVSLKSQIEAARSQIASGVNAPAPTAKKSGKKSDVVVDSFQV